MERKTEQTLSYDQVFLFTSNRKQAIYRISDIRTLYVLFLLSFLDVDSNTQTKTTFIDQHRDAFLAIFKGIAQDHYSLARKILEVCWAGVWSDSKLKRTLKVGLFNETTIAHVSPFANKGNRRTDIFISS